MDINDFFDLSKPFVRKTVSGGTTNGRVKYNQPSTSSNVRRNELANAQYEEKHVKENMEQLMSVNAYRLLSFFFLVLMEYLHSHN